MTDYTDRGPVFATDWTTWNVHKWQELLGHLVGESVRMVEVGCHEGRSSIWFLQNILTHAAARLVCCDPKPCSNFESNLEAAGVRDRVEFVASESRVALPQLADKSLAAAYLDGSHEAADVLRDGLEVLQKMVPGGVIIFDDYEHEHLPQRHVLPCVGIDAFLKVAEPHFVATVHKGWQLAVKVL